MSSKKIEKVDKTKKIVALMRKIEATILVKLLNSGTVA